MPNIVHTTGVSPGSSPSSSSAGAPASRSSPPTPTQSVLPSRSCHPAGDEATLDLSVDGSTQRVQLSFDTRTEPGIAVFCAQLMPSGSAKAIYIGVEAATPTGVLQYAHLTTVRGGQILWGAATGIARSVNVERRDGTTSTLPTDGLGHPDNGWVYFAHFLPDGQPSATAVSVADETGRTIGAPINLG